MKIAARPLDTASVGFGQTRNAWTTFWNDPAQSRCVAGAPEIWQALNGRWSSFARTLTRGTRILDLGCGAGAVARALLSARGDVYVTGIDFARLPLTIYPQVELLSDTAMESLPFAQHSFGAVVSQFGFEYSQTEAAARELAYVLAPEAQLAFLVHHAESSIVATNRSRLNALVVFLGPAVHAAFCAGDAGTFNALMAALRERHPHDSLVAELARSLPSRLGRAQQERVAIWKAIEDALAPERCLADSLNACCVAAVELAEWLGPLSGVCELAPAAVLREPDGTPIGWWIEGVRRPASIS